MLPPNQQTPRPGAPDDRRYNIAPTQDVLGIRVIDGVRTAGWFRWGLVPPGAKDLKVGARMINARAETLFKRGAFSRPARQQRCLIPADGFVEWRKVGRKRHPFHLRMKDGAVFAMAGIWQRREDDQGNTLYTCSIITTEANTVVAPVHNRMPVILQAEDYDAWLDPDEQSADRVEGLLTPYEADAMTSVPINDWVNDVAHDEPKCLTELGVRNPP